MEVTREAGQDDMSEGLMQMDLEGKLDQSTESIYRDSYYNMPVKEAFKNIDKLFASKAITLVESFRLKNAARASRFAQKPVKFTVTENKQDKAKTSTRQEKTIVVGHTPTAAIMTKEFHKTVTDCLDRAQAAFVYNRVDSNDVAKTITTHLNTDMIPHALTGLAPSYLITGVSTTFINMRPDGITFFRSLLNNDTEKIKEDPITGDITIRPFVVYHRTLSYVDASLNRIVHKQFHVENVEQKILNTGDSYLLQQYSNLIRLSSTTSIRITRQQCNKIANAIVHAITPFNNDVIRGDYHFPVIYRAVKHLFTESDINKQMHINAYSYYYQNSAFLKEHSDLFDVELFFDEMDQLRRYNCETKTILPPDSNATLNKKFKLIEPPICMCSHPNVLVFGSGDIVSSLSKHVLARYPGCEIFLVDPRLSENSTINIGTMQVHLCPISLFDYVHPHHHICHIISDVGREDETRDFSANDYRFTNYVAHHIIAAYKDRYTKLTLKMGFAYNIPSVRCDRVWHFKPQNPEFFVDVHNQSTVYLAKFLPHLLGAKLQFTLERFKYWDKQKTLIGISEHFPKLDSCRLVVEEPTYSISKGVFIQYSNGTHPRRMKAHVRPKFSFYDPIFSAEQKDLLRKIKSSHTSEEAIEHINNSSVSPTNKIFLIASQYGKDIQAVGSRLKTGLGIDYINKNQTETELQLLGNNQQYLQYDKRKKSIETLTASSKQIYLDINHLDQIIQARNVYPLLCPITKLRLPVLEKKN